MKNYIKPTAKIEYFSSEISFLGGSKISEEAATGPALSRQHTFWNEEETDGSRNLWDD